MKIKALIKHKSEDLIPCFLIIKQGKIQEIKLPLFETLTPYLNNSSLSFDIEIEKHYNYKKSPNNIKYYIKKTIDNEVFLMYLDINYIQHFTLQWQLKKYLIQSKEFKINLTVAIISGLIGYYTAKFTK